MGPRLLEETVWFVRYGRVSTDSLLMHDEREWGRMTDEPDKVDLETPDLAAENRAALSELFPGLLDDGVLDAAKLSELLDTPVAQVADGRERYGLQWAGRQEAQTALLAPSRAALAPRVDTPPGFDSAKNVFIEGDSLEVLKLLQKAYNDAIKFIYIDPPYNTGNDFVYADDFNDGLKAYLEYTGQTDESGNRTSAKSDATGRRHSKWLSMMYPRLVLARNLLTEDGVLAISIDENEVHQLKLLLDDHVFGPENHVNTFIWVSNLKGRQISDGGAVGTHEYILLYARNIERLQQFRGSQSELSKLMPSVYKGSGYKERADDRGPYVTKNELYNTNGKFNERTAPTMVFRIHYNPTTGEVEVSDVDDPTVFPGFVTAMPHTNRRPGVNWHAWRWSRKKVLEEHQDLEFVVKDGKLRIWTKIRDVDGTALKDLVIGPSTTTGQSDLEALGLARMFDTPKPVSLLRVLVSATTSSGDTVLDFFAGSGSTGHAVALQNSLDGADRRWLMINLPEPVNPESEAATAGFEKVSDITLRRLTTVLETVHRASDAGLRALTLMPSNFRQQDSDQSELDLSPTTLLSTRWDAVALEVLLAEGVSLDEKWERHEAAGGEIVEADGVAVVLSDKVDNALVEAALNLAPRVVVFMEDGFAGADAVKANAFTNAKNAGITMKTV